MGLPVSDEEKLQRFVHNSRFAEQGGVVTDLDGTAVHEDQGRIYIPQPVELGLKQLYDLGRPLVLNSLRFPLSVIRTFGKEWYAIANAPLPIVSLNGGLIGYVTSDNEEIAFKEIAAFPLTHGEIDEALVGVSGLLQNDLNEILVFYYPRDWRIGEVIWTPVAEKVLGVKRKIQECLIGHGCKAREASRSNVRRGHLHDISVD